MEVIFKIYSSQDVNDDSRIKARCISSSLQNITWFIVTVELQSAQLVFAAITGLNIL